MGESDSHISLQWSASITSKMEPARARYFARFCPWGTAMVNHSGTRLPSAMVAGRARPFDYAMEIPELIIEVASRPEAGDILISPQRCAQITCLVSIGDSQDELPAGYDNVPHKLRLLVADVVTEFGATEEDILQIVRLAEGLRSETGTVLIHCEAGVSRSSAAALIMYVLLVWPRARAGGDGESAIATSGCDPEPQNDSAGGQAP